MLSWPAPKNGRWRANCQAGGPTNILFCRDPVVSQGRKGCPAVDLAYRPVAADYRADSGRDWRAAVGSVYPATGRADWQETISDRRPGRVSVVGQAPDGTSAEQRGVAAPCTRREPIRYRPPGSGRQDERVLDRRGRTPACRRRHCVGRVADDHDAAPAPGALRDQFVQRDRLADCRALTALAEASAATVGVFRRTQSAKPVQRDLLGRLGLERSRIRHLDSFGLFGHPT